MRRPLKFRTRALPGTDSGFTLVELLVVMAIVALLLSIASPRYAASLDRSRDVALAENLKVMRVTIDRFAADTGRYPESLGELVERRYLREVPVDPITESSDSWVVEPSAEAGRPGIAGVRSGASGQTRDGRPYVSL